MFDRDTQDSPPAAGRRDSGAARWQSHNVDREDVVNEADMDMTGTTDTESESTSVAGSLTSID